MKQILESLRDSGLDTAQWKKSALRLQLVNLKTKFTSNPANSGANSPTSKFIRSVPSPDGDSQVLLVRFSA